MPTYDGIGTSITHNIEVDGNLFLQDIEGGDSTRVPLEIFSNFVSSPVESANSRMLRLRVQNYGETNTDNSYVTDMGIRGDPGKDYFFITAPQNTSNVGDQNTFVISTTSNVGIGTTDPEKPLHVVGDSWITGTLTASNIIGASPVTISSGLVMGSGSNITTSNIVGGSPLTITSDQNLQVNSNLTVGTSNLFVDTTTGRVGVGTASPGYKLHVSDDIYSGSGKLYLNAARTAESGVRGIYFRPGYTYNCSILTYDHNGNFSDGLSINGSDGVSFCSGSDSRNEVGRFNSGGLNVNGTINNGTYANANGFMTGRTACFGDITLNYGGATNGWQSSGRTAGLMLECLDTTEIAFHDAGARVTSGMYYSGNKIYIGRNMGYGALGSLILQPDGGNVGVGVASPSAKLHIEEDTSELLKLVHTGTATIRIGVDGGGAFFIYNPSSVGVYMPLNQNYWASNSDRRIKRDVVEMTNCLENISNIRPVYYNYQFDDDNQPRRIGFIAQEWQEHYPEVVSSTSRDDCDFDVLGLAYSETMPVLLGAIKEQQALIENLKARIEALENSS